ncbi:chitin-binding domain protein cbd-1-like [Bombus pyrosoma]|uniref:chitin-binding domain protein cbd-1-like n=1 Tax=Bombus pyrosoma TaxID=396416 RepID=UPI001CB9A354|nr:chitin-binding domain protein cbd-1-like [Bombus pyrosoma]
MADSIFSSISDLLLLVIAVLAVTRNAVAEIHEIPTKCPESSGNTVQLAHKHDCTKFYECTNGQKLLLNCPEFAPGQKLHFDPELQNCTFPWEANCASRAPDCSTDEFIQPHPINCSLYYKCENGEKVLKTCDEEQLFCSDSLECVHKDAAKCKVYDSCPTGKLLEAVLLPHHRQSLYYECVDGQYAVKRCPSGHEFDAGRRQCVSNVHCPATGTKRISHETNCGLYYECVDGVKLEKVCGNGLSFDETKGICTWPPRQECSSNFDQTDLATYFLPHAVEERDIVECPPEGYTLVHHECSCARYYYCEDGNKFPATCPNGMIFDYIRKVCDLPAAATCWNQKYTHDGYLYEHCYRAAECAPFDHSRTPYGECSELYYECSNGVRCDRSCDRGLVFNPKKEQCDIPENVGACNGDEPTTTTTTWRPPYCIEGNQIPHECNCYAYYVCRHGQYQWMQCPTGEIFDWAEKRCMPGNIAECRPSGHNECQGSCSSSSDLLPHKDCNKYCTCYHSAATVQTCPRHKYYDRGTQSCQWPEDISYWPMQCNPFDCRLGYESVPDECHCDRYYKCSGNGRIPAQCANGQLFDYRQERCVDSRYAHCYVSPSCDETKNCGICDTTKHDTSIYAGDCQKYCRCSGRNVYIEQCASGLYYDNVSGECAWPENVDLKSMHCPRITDCTKTSMFIPHNSDCKVYYKCEDGVKYLAECPGASSFDYVLGTCMYKDAHCYHEYLTNRPVDSCIGRCPEQTSSSPIIRLQHRDCSKYCVCSMGAPYVVNCPGCSRYDSQEQTCVPSSSCNCNLRANKTFWSDIPFLNNFL